MYDLVIIGGGVAAFSAARGKLFLLLDGMEYLEFAPSIAMGYELDFLLPQRDRLNMELMRIAALCPTNPKFDLSIQRSSAPTWLSAAASIFGGPGTVYFDSIQTIQLQPVDCR